MTVEEVKEFLNRGYRLDARIAAKQHRIEEWKQHAESITLALKPVAAFSSLPSKKVEDAVCSIIDLQNEISEEIAELKNIQKEISEFIKSSGLDKTDKLILEMRNLNGMKIEEIAVNLHYAYRWVQRRLKRAIESLAA